MSEQSHTPGPWETRGPTRVYGNLQRDQNGTADLVASTVRAADATMITATLDLVKALKEALQFIERHEEPISSPARSYWLRVSDVSRAAIAKAEGQ